MIVSPENKEEENDNSNKEKTGEIIRKMKYQSHNVTLDEWAYTYKDRSADMAKVITTPDVAKFLTKWPLYMEKPEWVSK